MCKQRGANTKNLFADSWLDQAAENCVSTCDYQGEIDAGGGGECDANRPCAIGCCSKFGVCGLGPDCEFYFSR